MAAGARTGVLIGAELAVAGVLTVLAGVSIASLAFLTVPGQAISLTPASIGSAVLGTVVIGAGIETFRRRHFFFAVGVPALLALGNLAYAASTRQWATLGAVLIVVLVVMLVAPARSRFRD